MVVSVGVLVLAVGVGLQFRTPVPEPARAPSGDAAVTTGWQLSPGERPGPGTVRLTEDAGQHPDGAAVQDLLQDHFDAINLRDYSRWTSTVVSERAAATSEELWREQYATSTDGSILVHRVQPRPGGGLTLLVSFTSVQDPTDAPEDAPFRCLRWHVSYPVVRESGQLRLDTADPGASRASRCR